MTNYLEVLNVWMSQPHYVLIILITIYTISAIIDFIIGSLNAVYSENIKFSSRVAQLGIIRKLVTLGVMILVIPLALMLPFDVGVYSLTILYLGVVISEIYSILGHVGLVKDGEKHKNIVAELFSNLLENIMNSRSEKK